MELNLTDQQEIASKTLSEAKEKVHLYEVVTKLLHKLSHSGLHFLHTFAKWAPPVWMMLFALSNTFEFVSSLTGHGSGQHRALKLFSAVVAVGFLAASFVFPPIAGVLFMAAMGFALAKSVTSTWRKHRSAKEERARICGLQDDMIQQESDANDLNEQYTNTLSCALSFVGTVLLFTPLAPVGLALLALSLVMSVGFHAARWIGKKNQNSTEVAEQVNIEESVPSQEETLSPHLEHHLSSTTLLAKEMVDISSHDVKQITHEALESLQSGVDEMSAHKQISSLKPAPTKMKECFQNSKEIQDDEEEEGEGDSQKEDKGTCHL